jgi:hypothetical protein
MMKSQKIERLRAAPDIRSLLASMPALALLMGPGLAEAQELPPADELTRAYVAAIGGEEAHRSATSIRTAGTITVAGMGLEGEFELTQIVGVGSIMKTNIPGIGEMQVGFDGEVGWSLNQVTGPSLMEDVELQQIRERSLLEATLRSSEVIEERETVERTEMNGRECYRVRLVWKSGRESFDCYAVDGGELVASQDVQVSAMGEMPVMSYFEEYRAYGGMRLPARIRQQSMGMEQIMQVREVIVDDADRSVLDLPPQIRTLVGG